MKHNHKLFSMICLGILALALANIPAYAQSTATLDIDGNGIVDGATDALLVSRYIHEFRGMALIGRAVDQKCTRCTASEIEAYMATLKTGLDIDGNGLADGATDTLLVRRYLHEFRGDTLIGGAVAQNCTRCTASEIEAYMATLVATSTSSTSTTTSVPTTSSSTTTTSTSSTTTTSSTTFTTSSSSTTTTIFMEDSFTNSLGMNFNLIPAGTFMMGSPEDEPGRDDAAETQHQVTLTKTFWIQTTEVTQGQWKAIMGTNPSEFQNCGDDCPVEMVSWNDAQAFISKINQRSEGTYRLPTEAEWEYAARAGSTTTFANGEMTIYPYSCEHDPNLSVMGWYCGNSGDEPHPVAQKQANTHGLYDLHGNLWEWCQDWYEQYPLDSLTDPIGPESGLYRVIRGGSWSHHARNCRSASRYRNPPSTRYWDVGFRLVVSPSQQK